MVVARHSSFFLFGLYEPTTDRFVAVMHGKDEVVTPGNAVQPELLADVARQRVHGRWQMVHGRCYRQIVHGRWQRVGGRLCTADGARQRVRGRSCTADALSGGDPA